MNRRPNGYWINERCIESAKKYNYIGEWSINEPGAYFSANSHGWLDDCCSHMTRRKPNGFYTKEICLADARKYNHARDWMKNSPSSFSSAYLNGWYRECVSHMSRKRKWSKEICIKIASLYLSKTEWYKNNRKSYTAAVRNGLIPDCCAHMKGPKPRGYWTKERCLENAAKYSSLTLWDSENKGAISAAFRGGWYDLCSALIRNNRNKP
jgi:hypothetical protein